MKFVNFSLRAPTARIFPSPASRFSSFSCQRDLILIFVVSWVAIILSVFPRYSPDGWWCACLAAVSMSIASMIAVQTYGATAILRTYVRCVIFLGIAIAVDFWRAPLEIISVPCRSSVSQGFAAVTEDIAMHLRWFPVSSLVMLGLVWLRMDREIVHHVDQTRKKALLLFLKKGFLRGVLGSLCMLFLMSAAINFMMALTGTAHLVMMEYGMASAMFCGMALYHILTNCWNRFCRFLKHRKCETWFNR